MGRDKGTGFETPERLRAQCVDILGWKTSLALFPVRHHSPTGARHLAAWLESYKPDVVLIEGPASYNDRIELLSDPERHRAFARRGRERREADERRAREAAKKAAGKPQSE